MRKELMFTLSALALTELSTLALSRGNRIERGTEQKWTCQADGDGSPGRCLTAELEGLDEPVSYMDGYWITLAHYNSGVQYYSHPDHDKPESARCLCDLCHAAEEMARGNEKGARLMLKMGVYNRNEAKARGEQIILTIEQLENLMEG